ncbi:MAG: glycosyltransferase family 4 protein, partial [Sulfuritalea sp.]|nr:glycosyltransferase family 4 protein [Sulfuritalea sp.]
MHITLIADTFPPLRSSGAVQLRDLSNEFVRQGHTLTVMLPSSGLATPWLIEDFNGAQVLRLRAPKTKDINYMHRMINEFLMPFIMLHNLRKSPLRKQQMDGVVWYAPSIFFGPLANALKKTNKCKTYLIIRDIFPEWAADVGLISCGLAYRFLKMIANYQYSVADVIGIQTRGNEIYFRDRKNCQIEVLQNWLTVAPNIGCSISLARTAIAGRVIFVYAGNMGVAQDMNLLIDLAELLLNRVDIGFLFVGRGSDTQRLQEDAKARGLFNVVFFDEI